MTDDRPVLLTVSGTIPADLDEQIAAGRRPRADYVEMAGAFDADLLDHAAARRGDRPARAADRPARRRATPCWRGPASGGASATATIFTDGEQVGLPYAALVAGSPGVVPAT